MALQAFATGPANLEHNGPEELGEVDLSFMVGNIRSSNELAY